MLWQGLVDYALAPAGGKVVGHSLLFPRPDDPAITTWNQIGAALIPGAMPAVHPLADKVTLHPCSCAALMHFKIQSITVIGCTFHII